MAELEDDPAPKAIKHKGEEDSPKGNKRGKTKEREDEDDNKKKK